MNKSTKGFEITSFIAMMAEQAKTKKHTENKRNKVTE